MAVLDHTEGPLISVNPASRTDEQNILVVVSSVLAPSDVNVDVQVLVLVRARVRLLPLPTRVLVLVPIVPILVLSRCLRRPLRQAVEASLSRIFALAISLSCGSREGEGRTCSSGNNTPNEMQFV